MEETFVDLGGNLYKINKNGQIYKRKGKGFIKCHPDKDGYLKVTVCVNNKTYNEFLHCVLWRAFKGPIPDGMTVDHIDGNKLNNNLDNYQLLSAIDNVIKGNAVHWLVTDPNGNEIIVYNLKKFCEENSLHRSHIASHSYKKWTARHVN